MYTGVFECADHAFCYQTFEIQNGGQEFEKSLDFALNWYTGGF